MTHAVLLQTALSAMKTLIDSDVAHALSTSKEYQVFLRDYTILQFELDYLSRPYDPKKDHDRISPEARERIRTEYRLLDPLYSQAREIVIQAQHGSLPLLQEKLHIGYPRAWRLLDALQGDVLDVMNTDSTWKVMAVAA